MQNPTDLRRAAMYLRISDDREGLGLGITRQRDDCQKLVDRTGYDLVGIFTDNDLGAYSGKRRPEWERLRELVKAGGVDIVVAWASDRLTRHPRELEDLVDLLERNNVKIQTVTSGEYDLTTPEGRAYARIVGAIARQESERKSVRAKRKALELAQAGKISGGGTRPFGYDDDRITVRSEEATEMRGIVDKVIAGATLQSICNDLQDREVMTPTGGTWQSNVLRRTLVAPRIAGLRSHRGEIIGDAEWDAVVDRGKWEQSRAILTDPRRRTNAGTSRTYLLTGGLVHCGLCGEPLVARPASGGRPAYVCASSRTGRFTGCGKIRVDAVGLEAHVSEQVVEALNSPQFVEALATESGVDLTGTADQIAEEEHALEQLAVDHYADHLIGRAEYLAARDAIESKLAGLRSKLIPSRVPSVDASDLLAWWASADVASQRQVVQLVTSRIEVESAVRGRNRFDPDRIDIDWI